MSNGLFMIEADEQLGTDRKQNFFHIPQNVTLGGQIECMYMQVTNVAQIINLSINHRKNCGKKRECRVPAFSLFPPMFS